MRVFNTTASGLMDSSPIDQAYFVNATSAAVIRTLPDATLCRGAIRTISKTDASANAVTVNTTSAQTITGTGGAVTSLSLGSQGSTISVMSDGAGWNVVARI